MPKVPMQKARLRYILSWPKSLKD